MSAMLSHHVLLQPPYCPGVRLYTDMRRDMRHSSSGFATYPEESVHNMNTSQKARQMGI